MMNPSSATQRRLATQFVSVTNASRENAQQFLRNANYNLDAAVNLYFNGHDTGYNSHLQKPQTDPEKIKKKLNEIFDGLLTEEDKGQDVMGVESLEEYVHTLGVNHLNYEFFTLLDIVLADSFGQITRKGFVEGWLKAALEGDATAEPLREPSLEAQKQYVRHQVSRVGGDPAYFKTLYQRAFLAGKETDKKAMDKEVALAFWEMLFDPAVHPWRSANVDWLDVWKTFVQEKWTRSVNRDMWGQTLIFAGKTMEDETLGFWSEDQAWPGVIDEFVLWCRDTGVVVTPKKGDDGMEMDD